MFLEIYSELAPGLREQRANREVWGARGAACLPPQPAWQPAAPLHPNQLCRLMLQKRPCSILSQTSVTDAWHLLTCVFFRSKGEKNHLNCKITLQEIMSRYHTLLCTVLPDNKATAVNIPFSLDFHLHIMQMALSSLPL